MKSHPYAELFPMMTDDELRELAADITTNGQREPITTLDGMILDGRNRFLACELDSNEPKLIEYDGNDPLAFVLSKNLKRRHLSESQRAMIAASLAKIEHGHNRYENKSKVDVGIPTSTQAKAAKAMNVSRDSVIQTRKIQDEGTPELAAAVAAGTVSVNAAAEVARLPKDQQKEIVEKGAKAVKDAAKKEKAKRKAKSKKKPEPVKQEESGDDGQATDVQQEAEAGGDDDPTVMEQLEELLKQAKRLIKKNPSLAKEAALAIHEAGEEVILYTPELKYGEKRPLYDSTYFRVRNGEYEGPQVQRLEGIGIKAIDTYGRMVPQELRDEFCEERYQQVGRHLQTAVMELHAADEIYNELSRRPLGMPWFNDKAWNQSIIKGSKIISDGLSAWMFDAMPYSICLFCNGHRKDDKGVRCLKCKFTGFWSKNEVAIHPTMIKDMRPKVAPMQEAKA
ncbi:MAG: hypothetical protein E6R03_16910 [Hyphomicrobiaceae bacterium]|nr:MAG: hypothetical protein E6R03_16910 [Hyphomicrobiaceae bacterium]